MTSETDSCSASHEPIASRREFVAAVTVAAATGAVAASAAQAQAPNLRFSNPPGMTKPAAYSHVVEVNGPHRVVYFAGQTGVGADGDRAGISRPGRAGDGDIKKPRSPRSAVTSTTSSS